MPSDAALNIADLFLTERVREGRGARVALRAPDRSWTYDEVEALAARFGNALLTLGVRPEERVLVALRDSAEYVGALFGILKVGAVVVMVNPDLPVEAIGSVAARARCRVALVGHAGAVDVEHTVVVTPGGPADVPSELEAYPTHPHDPAIWLFSGGTTGVPKIAVQTHASFANTTRLYGQQAMGYREDDITMSVPKLFFGYATGSNLFFPFSVGASAVVFPEHPTPEVLFTRIVRHRPTILINTPKMVADMLEHPIGPSQDLSCLRFATSAGEALPPSLYERWKNTYGVELCDGLGTAEMWHVFVTNTPTDVRPGTLGRAVPGFDVRVRDGDGYDLPDGEVGRLWVRGGSRALGYWQDLDASQDAFRGEWFVGGDLVTRDADGYFAYAGRGDDALKVGGKWLLPVEVEDCLVTHPLVAAAAVVGVPGADGLVKPVAFVVAAGGVTEELLQQHCLERLEPYKHPRRVYVVDDLPRTHLGKVDRGALRRLAGAS